MESLSAGHRGTLGNSSTYLQDIAGDFGGSIASSRGVEAATEYLRSSQGERSRLVGFRELRIATLLASLGIAIATIWPNTETAQAKTKVGGTSASVCYYRAQDGDYLWKIYDTRTGDKPNTSSWLELRRMNPGDILKQGRLVTIPYDLCTPTDISLGGNDAKEAGPDGAVADLNN